MSVIVLIKLYRVDYRMIYGEMEEREAGRKATVSERD